MRCSMQHAVCHSPTSLQLSLKKPDPTVISGVSQHSKPPNFGVKLLLAGKARHLLFDFADAVTQGCIQSTRRHTNTLRYGYNTRLRCPVFFALSTCFFQTIAIFSGVSYFFWCKF